MHDGIQRCIYLKTGLPQLELKENFNLKIGYLQNYTPETLIDGQLQRDIVYIQTKHPENFCRMQHKLLIEQGFLTVTDSMEDVYYTIKTNESLKYVI